MNNVTGNLYAKTTLVAHEVWQVGKGTVKGALIGCAVTSIIGLGLFLATRPTLESYDMKKVQDFIYMFSRSSLPTMGVLVGGGANCVEHIGQVWDRRSENSTRTEPLNHVKVV